ncbi:MAG TPA: sulfatase-like hydrolase/transferase [Planctomycetaceae bacterium]|jgi:arylsulfatase A-like enzyme/Flp pilus assembly protein TadD
MRRKLILFGVAAGVLTGLAVLLRPYNRPHLLLITLDTTRADRLGCYGYPQAHTPVLDALAAAGVLCEHAYTVAPLTLPAHSSLFTGLYPVENGIRTNGHGRLDDAIPTLAEVLRRRGYDTSAFVGSFVLNGKFGLDRGYNTYDDDFASDYPTNDALHVERTGGSVVDAALEWLKAPRSRPFFCWVHLFDPHSPYLPHTDLFGDEFAERPYDAEIAYVDQQIGRILEYLKARGLESQTLVVVVGDHGEGLGEHFEQAHGMTLYNATLHVPLIFRYPAQLAPGGRLAANVSMVDVSPTILDLLGATDPRKISGKSLKPALLGGSKPLSFCYGATDEAFLMNGWSPLRSLTEGHWKYIRTARPELYDLEADPREERDLAEASPDKLRDMESRLSDFESRLVTRAEVQVRISDAERRTLASLGYISGSARPAVGPTPQNLPDVKDMLPLGLDMAEAEKLIRRGSVDAGIEKLREVVRQAPSHTAANWSLAWTLWEHSKQDEGLEVFRTLLAVRPESQNAHFGLGLMLLQLDRFDDAITEFSKALEIDPDDAEVQYHLGRALLSTNHLEDALTHLDAAVELNPKYAAAYHWRAKLLARFGRVDAANADYRKALKFAPADHPEPNSEHK